MDENKTNLLPEEFILNKIHLIRGQKVIIDNDLAKLYEVETRVLKQQVKRNLERFPEDFMFELTQEENTALRSQIVILNRGQHSKYLPFAFTEQGIAMLSSVLNSSKAIEVNIQIMRTFVQLRKIASNYQDLVYKIEELEKKYDHNFKLVFKLINELINPPAPARNPIGYKI
jgi:hypothetical protein